jgi:hypothetical protein
VVDAAGFFLKRENLMSEDKEAVVLSIVETLEVWCKEYNSNYDESNGDYGNASAEIDKENNFMINLEFGWSGYEEGEENKMKILIMSYGKSVANHYQDGHSVMCDDSPPVRTVHKFNLYEELMEFIRIEMGM